MKIVLDTNVFISGVFWKGSPYEVLALWAQNKIHVVVSSKIIDEYLRVVHKIDKRGDIAKKWGIFVIENSTIVEHQDIVKICRDATDDKFLDCALIANADYLVSGDEDLLTFGIVGETKIVTPAQFMKIFNNLLNKVKKSK